MFAIRSSSVPVFCQCPKNLKNDNCCQKLWKASKIKLTFWKSHRFHFLNHCLNQWLSTCRELFDQWKISFSFHLEPFKMKTWEAFHHFWSRLAVFFSGFAITVHLANFVTLSVFTFYFDESNTIQKIHQVFPLDRHLDSLNSGKKFFCRRYHGNYQLRPDLFVKIFWRQKFYFCFQNVQNFSWTHNFVCSYIFCC